MNNIYLYITIYRLARVWKNTFAFFVQPNLRFYVHFNIITKYYFVILKVFIFLYILKHCNTNVWRVLFCQIYGTKIL